MHRRKGDDQLARPSDQTVAKCLQPVLRDKFIAPDVVHLATFDDLNVLGVVKEPDLVTHVHGSIVAKAVLLAKTNLGVISTFDVPYLRRQVLVEDVLLGGHTSHVGSVQAPDADVTFPVTFLDPARCMSVKVSANESFSHTFGCKLRLTRAVPPKDD